MQLGGFLAEHVLQAQAFVVVIHLVQATLTNIPRHLLGFGFTFAMLAWTKS